MIELKKRNEILDAYIYVDDVIIVSSAPITDYSVGEYPYIATQVVSPNSTSGKGLKFTYLGIDFRNNGINWT